MLTNMPTTYSNKQLRSKQGHRHPVHLCLICVASCRVLGGQVELSTQVDTLARGALVDKIVDSDIRWDKRLQYFYQLTELSSPDQVQAEMEILDRGDEMMAVSAASSLMRRDECSDEAVQSIVARMQEWSEYNQRVVFQETAGPGRSPHLIKIPRAFLRKRMTGGIPPERRAGSNTSAIDSAALILAESDRQRDKDLVRKAGDVFPESRGIWLCLANWGDPTADERQRAARIYEDESISMFTRVAAAASIAKVNADAERFVLNRLQGILVRYGVPK